MFSTHDRLRKRTPKVGIDRREYISLLVDEYYETKSLEAQQQVTANLANFAYDPINWNFLKQSKAHELFVEILNDSVDPLLLLHAAAGICNFCLDDHIAEYIVRGRTITQLKSLIAKHRNSSDLIGHLLTTLIYIKGDRFDSEFRKLLETLRNGNDRKISNLVEVLLQQNNAGTTSQTLLQQ
ncbi:armadillo repeat-containing protein 7 [Sabethes cyaneus]|uniref:armadillo repeat-containing protein 7 n=1 Tax=Sabethes cyaneus TaxID=53552 RepID=UPI00221E2B40|nr:armadillo repeat-containing protein 7 [Sabethes cyaneus]